MDAQDIHDNILKFYIILQIMTISLLFLPPQDTLNLVLTLAPSYGL